MTTYHIIAELKLPKQHMTRPFSVILCKRDSETSYSTHIKFNDDTGGMAHGHYDMSFGDAMDDFRSRCESELRRGSSTYESFSAAHYAGFADVTA